MGCFAVCWFLLKCGPMLRKHTANKWISVAAVAVGITAACVLLRLPGNAAVFTFDTEQTPDFGVTKLLPHFSLFLFFFLFFWIFFILLVANDDNTTHGNTDPTTEQKR